MNKRHNYRLDFLKFVFAMAVVLYHATNVIELKKPLLGSGNLAVEFFFIVSGCLMANSAVRKPKDNPEELGSDTRRFMMHKIARLMPNYYVYWLTSFLAREVIVSHSSLLSLGKNLIASVTDLLFLSESGFSVSPSLNITWYISAMLIVMLVCYPLLRKNSDVYLNIIAPLASIFLLGIGYQTFSNLAGSRTWVWGIMFKTLYRAFLSINLGCVVFNLANRLATVRFTALGRTLLAIAEAGLYLGVLAYLWLAPHSRTDFIALLFLAGAVTLTYSQVSCSNNIDSRLRRLAGWLGELSFSLYLAHPSWSKVLLYLPGFSGWKFTRQLLAYAAASLLSGLAIMYLSRLVCVLWKKHGQKIRSAFIAEAD